MANAGESGYTVKRNRLRDRLLPAAWTLAAAAAFCLPPGAASQTKAAQSTAKPAEKSAHRHHPAARRHTRRPVAAKQAEMTPPKPQAPPQPVWPVNQKPNPAQITWDAHGLKIVADNSSLDEVLHEVAVDIGAQVTGLTHDERIFGTYGPGPARDVLSRLLDGSGYNVLMVGDHGNGAPRQIELTSSGSGGSSPQTATPANSTQPAGQNGAQDGYGQQQEPPRPMPLRNPFGNAGPPRTPQQVLQEMQQRQQQMRQNQQ
ncbi:MAG: hypothetical protein ACLGPM_03150 [Acidobacteriota bacterium]